MQDASVTARPLSLLHRPLFIWTGIVIAILSMALMALWHLMGEPWKTSMALKNKQIMPAELSQTGSSDHPEIAATSPASSILGKDGNPMLFIQGGELDIVAEDSNDQQHTIRIQPFYMDKNMVTNHHFAEFLNEVKVGLLVENGVVKKNGETWFYLGKGTEPFEQIIYKHGRFHLRDVTYAAYPVVRVTWFGALAYARYYDKRLLTESEWDYLFSKQRLRSMVVSAENTNIQTVETPETSPSPETHTPMMGETHTHMMHMDIPSGDVRASVNQPSEQYVPSNIPARSDTNNVSDFNLSKEWAIRDDANYKEKSETSIQENIVYPSLIVDKSFRTGLESKSFRYPWEAFPDVGFRCVFTLGNN
jgi:serine/threonine-protein kinase